MTKEELRRRVESLEMENKMLKDLVKLLSQFQPPMIIYPTLPAATPNFPYNPGMPWKYEPYTGDPVFPWPTIYNSWVE